MVEPTHSRIAWVTGGGKGIGEAIARDLAAHGIAVAVSSRTIADVERVAGEIQSAGGRALAIACDVTQPAEIDRALAQINQALGAVNILVNNAGMGGSHKFLGHDDALWHRLLDVNLNSVYYMCKAVAPQMVELQWGRIVNIASVASKIAMRYTAAYTASKHGVLGLTRALAVELNPYNITVNAICPGYVDTPMTDGTIANMTRRTNMSETDARTYLEKLSPQNRLMTSAEVAYLTRFLLDDNARGITGQAINIDGGAVMW